ncbi:MAG: ABC transporter permease, partial [Verrucomicrobiales bacterium]|nr:ABC transporter permease [Verrucomicrobiales bacterium]
MTRWRLVTESLRHYWRGHVGLLLGSALAAAVLSGSLLVGDSVRASLRRVAAERLGAVRTGVLGGERWFTQRLAEQVEAAPLIVAQGAVSAVGKDRRANAIQVLGVGEAFWKMAPGGSGPTLEQGQVGVSPALAARLGVAEGDTVIVRLEQPSSISRDAPLSGATNEEVTLRRKVGAVVTAEQWGRFQLMASQVPPDSVFVPLADLQRQLDREGRVNVMLSTSDDAAALDARLNQVATLEDLALKLTEVQEGALKEWQVSTDRVFLDDALTGPLLKESGAYGVLTYLVNQLSSPDGKTPYSMATAVPEAVLNQRLAAGKASVEGAWISEWLAEDLQLKSGQELTLRYFVVGQGRELKEETAAIPVAGIVPMSSPAMSAAWTPDFPGVSEAENCRDWEPGIPMDMDAIRDKDEAYWDTYKGTPKVFVPLEQGQKWWHNRFGKLTAVRLPDGGETRAQMAERLMQRVSPRDIGLAAQDLGAAADRAAQGSVDFGGLFVGLSLFLVAGALLFAGLLFVFTLERRVSQIGLLISIGWTQKMVRRALLTEAFLIAIAGVALGLLGGGVYTRAALAGLGGAWADAAQGLQLIYAPQPLTVAVAGLSTLLVVMATLWWVSRRLFIQPPRVLLAGDSGAADAVVARGGWKVWAALIPCLLGAVALLWAGKKATDAEMVA